MISTSGLTKYFGDQTLFSDVSIQMTPGNCYGIVGANGSGKSTFLRMLAGNEITSDGTISIPKRARVGVLLQDHFQFENDLILNVAMMGKADVWKAMAEKEKILAAEPFDADRYSEVEDVILRHDGYTLEATAGEILEGLGIPTVQHPLPMSTLSGGFKLRVLLAQVLAADPEILLLDEPTNHLDILSIRWLEKFLEGFRGTSAVISHDHRFLDNVCSHIIDVDYETMLLYTGNYSKFVASKVEERGRQEHRIARQEKEIAAHRANIERFKAKATKARQASSKKKLLDRVEIERLPQTSRRYPKFRFPQQRPSGKTVVKVEGISKAYGEKKVLENVSLEVQRGDRLAIIGPNGIGKSTLLKIMMDTVQADSGTSEWGYEAHPGYFAQDHADLFEEAKGTVEGWLWDTCPQEPIGFVRGKLGLVLFSGDEVEKKISALSGGEGARLIFCRLGVQEPNILILDEPTNHLDLEAIEALVQALEAYEGTLIFVSHDRWFVSRLANRILEITPGGIRDFRGTYDEYLERCGDDHLDTAQAVARAKDEKKRAKSSRAQGKPSSPSSTPQVSKAERKKLVQQRDQITTRMESAENRIHEINEKFCNPGFFDSTDPAQVKKLEGEQSRLKSEVEGLLNQWEELESTLETL